MTKKSNKARPQGVIEKESATTKISTTIEKNENMRNILLGMKSIIVPL